MARKKKQEDSSPAGSPAWMTTYGDLMTLLLCFFVLLFSFSKMDIQKFKLMVSSLQGSFGVLEAGKTIVDDEFINGSDVGEDSRELGEIQSYYDQLQEYIESNELEEDVHLEIDERGLVVRFLDKVLFDSGKANLKPAAKVVLDEVIRVFSKSEKMIRVEGHTDNIPIHTALFPSNWELSTARAIQVISYFIEIHDVDPKRLVAAGYGEYHPISSNQTVAGRQLNRRIEIILLNTGFSMPESELLEPEL